MVDRIPTVRRIDVTEKAAFASQLDDKLPEMAHEYGANAETIFRKSRRLKHRTVFENLTREEATALIAALDCPAAMGFESYSDCDGGFNGFGTVRAAMAALKNARAAFDQAFEKGGE